MKLGQAYTLYRIVHIVRQMLTSAILLGVASAKVLNNTLVRFAVEILAPLPMQLLSAESDYPVSFIPQIL